MSKKFKVGDKVIGNQKADEKYTITKAGWVGEVVSVDKNYIYIRNPKAGITGQCGVLVDPECFDLYQPQEKIIIYRNGAEVIAKNTVTGKVGVAKCSKEDTFDFDTGAKLAFERLMQPEEPQYYSGKIVCIEGCSGCFMVGKVYEVEDGTVHDNYGNQHGRYRSLDDLNSKKSSKFAELIE